MDYDIKSDIKSHESIDNSQITTNNRRETIE